VFTLLAALLFLAQSGEAEAQSRSFQMALYVDFSEPRLTPPNPETRSPDTDILMFGEGQEQPPKPYRSIMKYKSWPTGPTLSAYGYDWSRIIAVVIDEPYAYFMTNDERNNHSNPCGAQDSRLGKLAQTALLLPPAADALKSIAPWTRLWVIFRPDEVSWMMQGQCSQTHLNQSYIDVISFDDYYKNFSELRTPYEWFATYPATPQQQMALVPGTFYKDGKDNPTQQSQYLQGYFAYAEEKNHSCNRPLGPRGVTGSYDGCLVWMVLGWLSNKFTDTGNGTTYVGELEPGAEEIARVWRQEVALPVRGGLSYELTRQQIVSTLLRQWLSD